MRERDELVARLRGWDRCWPARWLETAVADAADQIERDGREIERLRRELHYYADQFCEMGVDFEACGNLTEDQCSGCRARAALNGEGET